MAKAKKTIEVDGDQIATLIEQRITAPEETEPKADLRHWVAAMRQMVEEFRDHLNEKTREMARPKIEVGKAGASLLMPAASADPQRHSELHRLRMASDSFLAALGGFH